MKIMQVIPYFGLAGAEVMCMSLSLELKKEGNEVIVVSLYNKHTPLTSKLEKNGIKVIYLNKKRGLDLNMIIQLKKIFNQYRPDVVHSHLDTLKYCSIAEAMTNIKVRIHTVHNVAQKEAVGIAKKINNFAYHRLNVTPVALSDEVNKTIATYYNLDATSIPTIFNGVDLTDCNKKQDYNLTDQTLKIINVARFSEQKNQEMLIDCATSLIKENYRIHVYFVGDGEKLELMKKKVENLGIKDYVTFCGQQSNVHAFLEKSDVFILPSHYEGMPMSIIEAMGTGLPVIATRVGGIPSMIKNEESGILINDDLNELIDAVKKIFNKKLREKLGENAYVIANKKFSAVSMTKAYSELYKNIMLRSH